MFYALWCGINMHLYETHKMLAKIKKQQTSQSWTERFEFSLVAGHLTVANSNYTHNKS